ncbi:MAG: bifunctional phosphopantothenoylcysteine decarboxylase/phosphopantothenate--cysteine ligase CoaBC [Candidatus Heimdallarchaeota archaeon]|nr:bifunctional phosphopantothenoylcysteine decarboxylase/phosphopantothenate--cysteine ligase CoaBC [Candidatus Heimdallarchaeota archaeon]
MAKFIPTNHSSKLEITGKISNRLAKKRIVIGMTGSVAVVEIVHLARLLMRNGAEVFVAMTPAAMDLIHPNLIEWATGNPVITELTGQIEHVHLCGQHPDKADLLLIAPSTANTIGKIAGGIDDTVVTTMATTALGTGIPIAIVPAMHVTMYENPIVIENIEKLKKLGIMFIGPRIEEGKAKIASNDEILETIISLFSKKNFSGKKIVITAGPTRVWLDDIRFISNPSSGKMGIDIALEAASQGADVILLLGPTSEKVSNPNIKVIQIESPDNIISEINKLKEIDIFISAAAISDYKPKKVEGKIRSGQENLEIQLVPTPKIIDYVKTKFPKTKIIGFKAETNISEKELITKAFESLKQHEIEMVVGNLVNKPRQGFKTATNAVVIVKRDGKSKKIPLTSKREIAQILLEELE